MKTHNITTLSEVNYVASLYAQQLERCSFFIIALTGDLASGKTTFTQTIAKKLGVVEHVQSPTYTLERTYQLHTPAEVLHHFDLYRLHTLEDIYDIGMVDLLQNKKGIFVIEWPELLFPYLDTLPYAKSWLHLHFQVKDTGERILQEGR